MGYVTRWFYFYCIMYDYYAWFAEDDYLRDQKTLMFLYAVCHIRFAINIARLNNDVVSSA